MVRHVVTSPWLPLLAVLAGHANARGKLHLGRTGDGRAFSITSDGRLARHEHHGSPGFDTLLQKLGMGTPKTQTVDSGEDDDEHAAMVEKRERRKRERYEDEMERDADEGEQLQEEYERKERERSFPLTDSEKPHHRSRMAEDEDEEDGKRDHRRSRYEDDEEDISPPPETYKRRHHSSEDDDETLIQKSTRRDDSEYEDEEDSSGVHSRTPKRKRREEETNDESDHRRIIKSDFAEEDDKRRIKSDEVEDDKRRIKSDDDAEYDDNEKSRTGNGYSLGEDIRAYHVGNKLYQGGKVAGTHLDGTVIVNWDSGDMQYRTVNATDVFRTPRGGSDGPFRFEGPNAYNLVQEKQNKVSAMLRPSKPSQASTKIFDGYTLFPPSALGPRTKTDPATPEDRVYFRETPPPGGVSVKYPEDSVFIGY